MRIYTYEQFLWFIYKYDTCCASSFTASQPNFFRCGCLINDTGAISSDACDLIWFLALAILLNDTYIIMSRQSTSISSAYEW